MNSLPNVDTDVLITVNVPYPDEESAAQSLGTVDSFLPKAEDESSQNGTDLTEETFCNEGPQVSAVQKNTIVDQERPPEKSDTLRECAEGMKTAARDREEASAIDGGGHLRRVEAGGGVIAMSGVAVMRSLVESFDILDWSLFG